jgi:hypothetical protein
MADGPVREIRDENGDLRWRVTEVNAATVLRALRCESQREVREVLDYPDEWRKLTDRQLDRLCRTGQLLEPGR